MKIAFLDRDGTINRDHPDETWATVAAPELYPDTIAALRMMGSKGYGIIVLTNQYLIGEGFIDQAAYGEFTGTLRGLLHSGGVDLLDIFHCPHRRDSGCGCCKPGTGMIERALERYPQIAMEQSFIAGDSEVDVQLAQNAGLPFYRVDYDSGREDRTLVHIARRLL